MRTLVTTISALIAMSAQTQAMDWDTFTGNEYSIAPPATVSFSIGYPKGWRVTDLNQRQHDIYKDVVVLPPVGPIWIFFGSATTDLKEQGHTFYTIEQSCGTTAKEAAEEFIMDIQSASAYTPTSISPVKTSAGDSGWLVESEGYLFNDPAIGKLARDSEFIGKTPGQKIPVIYHDFFFHTGKMGAIRIQIMTDTANASWRSQLDRVVLDTLRFHGS
jgi:hypothetical protein